MGAGGMNSDVNQVYAEPLLAHYNNQQLQLSVPWMETYFWEHFVFQKAIATSMFNYSRH